MWREFKHQRGPRCVSCLDVYSSYRNPSIALLVAHCGRFTRFSESTLLFFFPDRSVGSSAFLWHLFFFIYILPDNRIPWPLSVTSHCVCLVEEKKKEAWSRPPSVALELLLLIDEPAAADGRIFCLIYVSAARRRSDQTADSSLSNAAAGWQASSPASSPAARGRKTKTPFWKVNWKVDERGGEASRPEPTETVMEDTELEQPEALTTGFKFFLLNSSVEILFHG